MESLRGTRQVMVDAEVHERSQLNGVSRADLTTRTKQDEAGRSRTKIDGKDLGFTWSRFAETGQIGADETVTIDIDRALVSRAPSDQKRIES